MKKGLSGNTSRLVVLAAFFANGVIMATWVSRIPTIQARLDLSEGELGLILTGPLIIGFVAENTSLRIALSLVMVLAGSLVFTGKAIPQQNKKITNEGAID